MNSDDGDVLVAVQIACMLAVTICLFIATALTIALRLVLGFHCGRFKVCNFSISINVSVNYWQQCKVLVLGYLMGDFEVFAHKGNTLHQWG